MTTYLSCLMDVFFNKQSEFQWVSTALLFSPTCFFISMKCVIPWLLKTKYVDRIYRTELEIKETTETARLSLAYNYFIWSKIQRGSKTSFTNLYIYTIINTLCNVCFIVEQVLLFLPEHLSSSPVFGGVPVANF
jgi:hypothetical protein